MKKVPSIILRLLGVTAGIVLLLMTFKDVDLRAVMHAVGIVGYAFPGILTVYLIGCLFDVLAWRRLMPASGAPRSFLRLLGIHLAGESFYRFLPAGVVVGDGLKTYLMRKQLQMEYSEAVSSVVLRKLIMGIAQVFYIGAAIIGGLMIGAGGAFGAFEWAGGACASGLLITFMLIWRWIMKGRLCMTLHAALLKVPSRRLRQKLASAQSMFAETDHLLQDALGSQRRDVIIAVLLFALNWMTELAETLIILFVLGSQLSFTGVMFFEPIISLVRSIAFMFPGGLGVMDAGYMSAVQAFGLRDAAVVGAAFIIIKRSKEVFWIVIGIALAGLLGRRRSTDHHTANALAGFGVERWSEV